MSVPRVPRTSLTSCRGYVSKFPSPSLFSGCPQHLLVSSGFFFQVPRAKMTVVVSLKSSLPWCNSWRQGCHKFMFWLQDPILSVVFRHFSCHWFLRSYGRKPKLPIFSCLFHHHQNAVRVFLNTSSSTTDASEVSLNSVHSERRRPEESIGSLNFLNHLYTY